MQLFINNWSAALTAPAAVSAAQLSIDPAQAAKLVGLGSGDYYLLTLAAIDVAGAESDWEIVKVTGVSGGALDVVRSQEGMTAREWDAGTHASARATAGGLAALRGSAAGGLLTREGFVSQIMGGALGIFGPAIAFGHADIGAMMRTSISGPFQSSFPWLTPTPVRGTAYDGALRFTTSSLSGDAGFCVVSATDRRLRLTTGTAAGRDVGILIGAPTDFASIEAAFVEIWVTLQTLSTAGQDINVDVEIMLPSFHGFGVRYSQGSPYWVADYIDDGGAQVAVTTSQLATKDTLTVIKIAYVGMNIVIDVGSSQLVIPVIGLSRTPSGLNGNVTLYKGTGSTPASVLVERINGEATLPSA